MRAGVLISGRGSNLAALIEACQKQDYPAKIAVVVSNVAGAFGLERARGAGIEPVVIDHRKFPSREAFDDAVTAALNERGVELVCNAGFMRLHSPAFVREWHGRQLNIHPSLLPAFRGLHPQRRAIEAGARIAGCTVHFVSEEMDAGPIIAQAAVPILPDDDEDSLSERILRMEHRLYPHALGLVASGKAALKDGRVHFATDAGPLSFLSEN